MPSATARHCEVDHFSNARVPGITAFGRCGTQALAEPFQAIGDRQARNIFHALVAELAGNLFSPKLTARAG